MKVSIVERYYLIISLVFIISLLLTYAVRIYALRRSLLDIPNDRSSHTIPTPRGGGLAIVVSFFLGIIVFAWQDLIPDNLALALTGGGSLVVIIGFLDDRYNLAILWRLAVQFLGAAIALYVLDIHTLTLFKDGMITVNWFSEFLLVLMIVWLINLYNFMDGIDGLASSEAIFASLAASVMLPGGMAYICWMLAAAVAGFLMWNWPPAKIFMGDVSSGLLGFTFAILGIYTASQQQLPLIVWFILLAVFIIDASLTLIRRFLAGEKWYAPHRSHAYQRLVQQGSSHRRVTLIIIAFNGLVLLPLAICSTYQLSWSLYAGLLAFVLCTIIWYKIISRYQFT